LCHLLFSLQRCDPLADRGHQNGAIALEGTQP
jgi:hypothetical protein